MSAVPSLHVRNLGPIREGTVQLHPLTILTGKNNTGKTYMAQAIYAAYKSLELANGPVKPSMTIDEGYELLDQLQARPEGSVDILHGSLREKAQQWMRSRMDRAGRLLKNRLEVYFDLGDLTELTRWQSRRPLNVSVAAELGGTSATRLFGLRAVDGAPLPLPPVLVTLPSASPLMGRPSVDRLIYQLSMSLNESEGKRMDVRMGRVSNLFATVLSEGYFLPSVGLAGRAYYLPAGRSGLLEAWTDVVRLRLQQDRDRLALTGREPAALGGIALDFLSELQQLMRSPRVRRSGPSWLRRRNVRSIVEPAADHLRDLIQGDIGMDAERDVPSLTYTQGKKSIPIQSASSMVAEIAPLLSWIVNVLEQDDLLLIDEPEAHMHPEAILAVAEALVALSQAGIKVLCTTHSSDFLHQVSNCMLRSVSGSGKTPSIDTEHLGVYRFERPDTTSGTRIERLEIDPGWGIPEDEHVAVAEGLFEETAELVKNLG